MEAVPGRFELGALHLATGEGTRAELNVDVEPVKIGSEEYTIGEVPVVLDVARMIGGGYSLRLRAEAGVSGTCLRCLDQITLDRTIDIREVDRPDDDDEEEDAVGGPDDLVSPYVEGDILSLGDWLRDTLVLELPATMAPPVNEDDDRCQQCKRTLIDLGAPTPSTEPVADPRWAKLAELKLDGPPRAEAAAPLAAPQQSDPCGRCRGESGWSLKTGPSGLNDRPAATASWIAQSIPPRSWLRWTVAPGGTARSAARRARAAARSSRATASRITPPARTTAASSPHRWTRSPWPSRRSTSRP